MNFPVLRFVQPEVFIIVVFKPEGEVANDSLPMNKAAVYSSRVGGIIDGDHIPVELVTMSDHMDTTTTVARHQFDRSVPRARMFSVVPPGPARSRDRRR